MIPSDAGNLIDLVRARAADSPDRTVFTFLRDGLVPTDAVTFADLDRRARETAAWLQARFPSGARVLLLHPPGIEFTVAFLGCVYAGLVAIPAYPPRGREIDPRIRAIASDAQAALALTTLDLLPRLTALSDADRTTPGASDFARLQWAASDALTGVSAGAWRDPVPSGDTPAHLQYTSGSTATPKGVIVTHRNLLRNLLDMHLGWQHDADSVIVSWLPHFHDMGLVYGLLEPIFAGVPCYQMPPVAFIQKPVRWLQAITTFKATHSAAPNFAYDLCVRKIKPDDRLTLDLGSWVVAVNGAEAVRAETMSRFVDTFGPAGFRDEVLCPGYGLAEATLKVTASPRGQRPVRLTVDGGALNRSRVVVADAAADGARTLVGCGASAIDTEVAIVDPDSRRRCGQDGVGEVWVAGSSVAAGYWNRPAETAETFGAVLTGESHGPFLRTGDLGFLRDGQLYIVGRLKDLIIIRGQNYYPQDLEQTVEAIGPGVRSHGCAAFSVEIDGEERLIVAQEIERAARDADAAEIAGRIRQRVAEAFEVQVYDVVILREGALPRTSSGKIQRQACRLAYTGGTFEGRVTQIAPSS
ncbi:MAG: fatty acyl-AMP ligase [Vicinamibacterales bacterium]